MAKPITWIPVKVKLSELDHWADNPVTLSKAQAQKLLRSEKMLGKAQAFSVSPKKKNGKRDLYDGHQRCNVWGAAYGMDTVVNAVESSRFLTDKERRRMAVMTRTATGSLDADKISQWDSEELFDFGYDADYLSDIKHTLGGISNFVESEEPEPVDAEPQINRAEELQKVWGTKLGQLWQIGQHRLLVGDCTVRENVERLMGGKIAKLAPVDPPYNVGFEYDGETVDDKKTEEKYKEFCYAWFGECQRVSEKQIVTAGCYNLLSWLRWFDSYHVGTWIKSNSMTNGRISRFWCWEPVIFFGEKFGKKRTNDIFDYPIGQQKDVANHPCPKPLKMWVDLIENYSEPNDIIYESFGGSGTTMVVCGTLDRQCRMMEISPAYSAVILQRMADAFPGIEIKLIEEV